jgi:hypothetical protein
MYIPHIGAQSVAVVIARFPNNFVTGGPVILNANELANNGANENLVGLFDICKKAVAIQPERSNRD